VVIKDFEFNKRFLLSQGVETKLEHFWVD